MALHQLKVITGSRLLKDINGPSNLISFAQLKNHTPLCRISWFSDNDPLTLKSDYARIRMINHHGFGIVQGKHADYINVEIEAEDFFQDRHSVCLSYDVPIATATEC